MILKLPKKGQLLIAEPSIIGDLEFNRAVIFVAEHSAEGSIGFILNKPLHYSISDLVPLIKLNFEVYKGGPVAQDSLYFIHNIPNLIPNSIEIYDGLFWGGDFNLIIDLLNSGLLTKNNIRFFLGYTGWDGGQLKNEINAKSWIPIINSQKNKILEKETSEIWKEKIMELGGEYVIWCNAPEDPILN